MIDYKGAAHRNIDTNLLDRLNMVGISETDYPGFDRRDVAGDSRKLVLYSACVLVHLQEKRNQVIVITNLSSRRFHLCVLKIGS
jgi:hypothetical protein